MSSSLATGDLFIPVKIDQNDPFVGIRKLLQTVRPNWSPENTNYKIFTDGITNKLVACQYGTEDNQNAIVLVRIYGNKTDLLIDRKAELRNINTLNKLGLAPKIYAVFENGLAYQYYPGETLTVDTVKDYEIWPLVALQMAKMHKVIPGKEVIKEPMVWDKTEQFLSLLPNPFSTDLKQRRFVERFGSITKLRIEFDRLRAHLAETDSPLVFAHNDLLLGNVVYNKNDGTISFIDYEYAAYNYQAFDIANHFNEFVGISLDDIDYEKYPSKEFQIAWIKVYLTEYTGRADLTDAEMDKLHTEVQKLSLASHFFWGIWSLVQFEHSDINFDFLRYAEIRLSRYYECKNKVLKEFI